MHIVIELMLLLVYTIGSELKEWNLKPWNQRSHSRSLMLLDWTVVAAAAVAVVVVDEVVVVVAGD